MARFHHLHACLLAACLTLPAFARAAAGDFDGQWATTLSCGANASNGRPGFSSKVVFNVSGGRIAQVQSQTTGLGAEETRWEGRIDGGNLVLGAEGRRIGEAARWNWSLTGKAAARDRIDGTGAMLADGRKIRDCTVEMRLDTPAAAAVAAVAPAAAPAAAAPVPAQVSAPAAAPRAAPASPAAPAAAASPAVPGAAAAAPAPAAAGPATAAASAPTPAPSAATASAAANRALQAAQSAMPALAGAVRGTPAQVAGLPAGAAAVAAAGPAAGTTAPAPQATAAPPSPSAAATAAPAAQAPAAAVPSASSAPGTPAGGLSPVEQRLEAIAGNRNLDLLLLVSNANLRGTIRRSVAGDWSLHADRLCIDIGELVKADGIQVPWSAFPELGQRTSGDMRLMGMYQALRFVPARQYGLREPPRPGFSGPTPTVSAGIPSRSQAPRAESDSADYWATLGQAFEAGLQKRFGRPVAVAINLGGSGCSPDAVAIPRLLVDPAIGPRLSSRWAAGVEAGQLHEVATVPIADYRAAREVRQQGFAQAARASDALLKRLAASPPSGPEALYGAMGVGGSSIRACHVVADAAGTPRHGLAVESVLRSEAFARFQSGRPSSLTKFDSIDALYADLQKRDGRCTVVLGNGPTLAALKTAVDRDRQLDGRLMPDPLDEAALLRVHAAALGFKDGASYLFGNAIGVRDAAQVSRLQQLGVANPEQFAAARKRLEQVEPGARENVDALIQLVADEREASAKGTTVKALRTERARREEEEARRHAQALAASEKAKAVEYPFVAVFSCSIAQQKAPLQACMSSGSVDTEIELKNGSDYRMYKIHDVASMGRWTGEEMIVDLRRSFEIKAQNADRTLVLNLVVKDRSSGRVLYQRSAAQFGVMRVAN